MTKRDARRLDPRTQEELRFRAVAAVESGRTATEVAHTMGVSRQQLQEWLRIYRTEGEEGLRNKRRGPTPGRTALLAPWQQGVIVRMITDKCPEQLKLPFYLWTREAIAGLIKERFGITIAIRTVGDYLQKWGFTPQKPARRAVEQDPRAVRAWKEKEYPRIAKEAKAEGAEIHWADETGVRSDHYAGRSYSPRGKTPVIERTGKRFGINIISSVTNHGTLRFMAFQGKFSAEVFIEFLERLAKSAQRKVYVIVDRHSVHRSGAVSRWVEANASRVRLILIPPYTPEVNPDEYLNNDLKENGVGRNVFHSVADMLEGVRSYLWGTQKRPDIVRSYFLHPDVLYAN